MTIPPLIDEHRSDSKIGVFSISHGCNHGPVFARINVEWFCPPELYGDGHALEAADRLASSVVEAATPAIRQIVGMLRIDGAERKEKP